MRHSHLLNRERWLRNGKSLCWTAKAIGLNSLVRHGIQQFAKMNSKKEPGRIVEAVALADRVDVDDAAEQVAGANLQQIVLAAPAGDVPAEAVPDEDDKQEQWRKDQAQFLAVSSAFLADQQSYPRLLVFCKLVQYQEPVQYAMLKFGSTKYAKREQVRLKVQAKRFCF